MTSNKMYKEANPVWITANLLSRERNKICTAEEAGVEYRQQGTHDKINCFENQA